MNRSFFATFLGLSVAALVACSDDSTSTPGTSTPVGQWPSRPTSGAATTDERTFAVNSINLGDAANAWKSIGYNLDGKVSTAESTDVCKNSGGQASVHANGDKGIDNAFGNKIISYISSIESNPSKRLTDAMANGSFTLILKTKGLSDSATQSATGVTGELFTAGKFDPTGATKPTFTKADNWPVRESLTPKATFANGYVANGTWVSGDPADISVTLVFSGQSLTIVVHHAVVTFNHSAPGEATSGVIAGVLKTSELQAEISKVAGSISSSFCPGSANADKLTSTINDASDIKSDGTNAAGSDCDGISVGLGFTAKEISAPSKVSEPDKGSEVCPK